MSLSFRAIRTNATVFAKVATLAATLGVVAFNLGGCANVAVPGGASYAQAGAGATVAFESVDGPPPQVFDRLVSALDSEARLRNLAVVSRQDSAAYRVRSYLAAQIRGGRTTIAWVWDVYDRDQQRAIRLAGEEQAGKAGRDAWASADDVVLRRIAQAGLTGLGNMINGTPSPDVPAVPAPRGTGPAIASASDFPAMSAAFADSRASFTEH